jgi:hypothetical protein
MIHGLPCDHSTGFGAGLAATNAMAVEGIKSGDNLLAVISWTAAGVFVGQDKTDFTVAAGTITAGTIDLSSTTFVAIWTNAPAS